LLRELFRHHQAWHSAYEARDVEDVLVSHGFSISLWDLDYLVSAISCLPTRQRQAIQLCFLDGLREEDAAIAMGVSPTNPVSMYANAGLVKILAMIERGDLVRYTKEII